MDWNGAINFWRKVKRAVPPAAEAAANNMARELKAGIRNELSRFPHAAHTPTPSPPGSPPGLISGRLRESVLASPATPRSETIWVAHVGPHTRYAAIQEYGGTMHGHGGYMSWVTLGRRYYQMEVTLPPRPYVRPTGDRMSANGQLTRAARDGFAEVIYSAEGI